jgi:hypothetical protein
MSNEPGSAFYDLSRGQRAVLVHVLKRNGFTGAEIGRLLGVPTATINRIHRSYDEFGWRILANGQVEHESGERRWPDE